MRLLVVQRGSLSSKQFVVSRSVFNRVLEPLEYLEATSKSVSIQVMSPEDIVSTTNLNFDVAIFCKHNTAETVDLAKQLQTKNIKIIYDFDDLIYKFTEDSIAYEQMNKVSFVQAHLEMADLVVFSNVAISDIVRSDFQIKKSCIIKTGINTDKYYNSDYENIPEQLLFTNGDNIKVEAFRNDFISEFNTFLCESPIVQFHVFGDTKSYLQDFTRYNFLGSLPWNEHKYYLMKNRYKFAIVPLGSEEESETHQQFSICKTPIKYLEYGALRIPAIYSDAHIYREVVQDRLTGMLVPNTREAWRSGLRELNGNLELREKIAANAFDDVAENHHIKIAAKKWFDELSNL